MNNLKLNAIQFGAAEVLTRVQMKNVLGGYVAPPGDCADGCGPTNACPVNQPYCLTTTCTDKAGVRHEIKGCSPTLP